MTDIATARQFPRAPRDGGKTAIPSLDRLKEGAEMTMRRLAINVLTFIAIIIVMTAAAIWLNLGPVANSVT